MKYLLPLLLVLLAPVAGAAQLDAAAPVLTMGTPLTAQVAGAPQGESVQGTPDVLVFDSFTGAVGLTTTSGVPRTFMGFPFNLGNAGGSSPMISSATVYLAYTGAAAQTYNSLRVRMQLWNGFTAAATPIFSAPTTLIEADVAGPVTLNPNTFVPITLTFPAPIPMTALTGRGIGFNFQGDTGAGLASADALTTLLRTGATPIAVGTSGMANTNEFGYRNASNRTDFNFVPGDLRSFAGVVNAGLAFQLFAQGVPLTPQAITNFVATPANPSVSNGSFVVSATGGPSGNPVTFTIDAASASVCSAGGTNGATITILTAGTCTVLADQAGNATHSPAPQATLAVTIGAGNLTITPAIVAFGNQTVGTTSAASTVTLANDGTASLDVTALTTATAPFVRAGGTCANTLPITIAAGANCTLTYTFSPTAVVTSNQTLTVTANAPGSGSIALSGTGTAAPVGNLTITPAAVAFGNQAVGTTSAASTVTLANDGTASLDVTALTAATAPFARAGGTCANTLPITIAAGANCTLTYTFAPTAVVTSNQTLTVTANAPGSGSIALSGTGTGTGVLGVLSSTVNFGTVVVPGNSTGTLTLTNTGTAPLQVTDLTAALAPFAATGGTCGPLPITINAGASCTVIYTFTPTSQQNAVQTITITSSGGTATATLQGTGTVASTVAIPTIGALSQLLMLVLLSGVALLILRRR